MPINVTGQFIPQADAFPYVVAGDDLDIINIAQDTSPDPAADFLVINDAGAGSDINKRVLVQTLVASALANRVRGFIVRYPTASMDKILFAVRDAITVTRIYGETDVATSTVDFTLYWRAEGSSFSAGTQIESTVLVADDDGQALTPTGEDPTIPANSVIAIVSTAIANAPTELLVKVEYTIG